jgi:hypothetical protein
VLASLKEVEGVEEAKVDHSGRYFLLVLEPGAEPRRAVDDARRWLEDAERVEPSFEATLLDGYREGEKWFGPRDAEQLSREEARHLAEREGRAAAAALGLDAERAEKLVRVLEEELARAFERIHAAGGGLGERADAEFAAAAARLVERSAAFLTTDEVRRLREHSEVRLREQGR